MNYAVRNQVYIPRKFLSIVASVTLGRPERSEVAIECDCEAEIRASPADCLTVAADASRWQEWARDLERVRVLAPLGESTPMRVEVAIEIFGVEKSATIDISVDRDAHALTFAMVESPSLTEFAGGVRFIGNGPRSRMAADLRAELIRHKTARIERMAGRKIETALTRDFVRYVERSRRGR